jgi:hypothetical protein
MPVRKRVTKVSSILIVSWIAQCSPGNHFSLFLFVCRKTDSLPAVKQESGDRLSAKALIPKNPKLGRSKKNSNVVILTIPEP